MAFVLGFLILLVFSFGMLWYCSVSAMNEDEARAYEIRDDATIKTYDEKEHKKEHKKERKNNNERKNKNRSDLDPEKQEPIENENDAKDDKDNSATDFDETPRSTTTATTATKASPLTATRTRHPPSVVVILVQDMRMCRGNCQTSRNETNTNSNCCHEGNNGAMEEISISTSESSMGEDGDNV